MTPGPVEAVLAWVSSEAKLAVTDPAQAFRELWVTFGPGGRLHPSKFLENDGHLVIESLLMVAIAFLLFQRTRKPISKSQQELTEKEVDELCADWTPEPLVPENAITNLNLRTPVLDSITGPLITVDGKKDVSNFASANFWGLAGHPDVQAAGKAAINKYGVGSCGPRGFYGTIDVHLHLEKDIALFMGTEEAIVYSYDTATQPSVIPALASSKDVLVVDEAAAWPIRNGATLSRAQVIFFRHNDLEHLESVLQGVIRDATAQKKPLNRRFIIVEGISANCGDVTPLTEVMVLKEKYKFRIVVDESLSFGVLGANGRGACEHAGLKPGDADVITASLSSSVASIGGFCAGSRAVVDHQRLSGAGYVFSASQPPVLAVAASETLKIFQTQASDILSRVQANARLMRTQLAGLQNLTMIGGKGDELSPVIHLRMTRRAPTTAEELVILAGVRDSLLESWSSTLLALHRPGMLDSVHVVPALKCLVTASHTKDQIVRAAAAIKEAALHMPL